MQSDWPDVVEKRLVALETHNAVAAVQMLNVSERLSAIEDTLKWLVRLIVGGLVVAGITYVVQGGLAV
ncbi:Haemolysin XhlA [Loktanella sp. DSM 29012]|uniref:Hemolysin XhlA family protein n=1 Tax=Loktanella gaetbuli TaxID=2881335 RepID=A0ABS8BS23_9RHOB|nr:MULTISPECIES: hemolysin XhlA family protein [Loktanella]MCB5198261.1 hemolysin XhlA family protein [Loktanella gaetbuli]SEQ70112.1 Haemolysin XhlA [Loktanella sp. DSM 29012]